MNKDELCSITFSFIHIIFEQVLPLFSITPKCSRFYSTSRDINVGASSQSLDSLNISNYFSQIFGV